MQVSAFARVPQIQQVHFISDTPAKKRVVPTATGHRVFFVGRGGGVVGGFLLVSLGRGRQQFDQIAKIDFRKTSYFCLLAGFFIKGGD